MTYCQHTKAPLVVDLIGDDVRNLINAIIRFVWGFKRPSKATNARLLRKRGETLDSLIIREATAEDIPALAALHVKTWADTYWNVKHPPTYKIREHQWQEQFKVTDGSWFCFVVENPRRELVGFASGGVYSSTDLPGYSGQLR